MSVGICSRGSRRRSRRVHLRSFSTCRQSPQPRTPAALIEAARQLPLQGFARPVVAVVHGIFAEESFQRLAPLCDRIVSSDSVPHESNAVALAGLIARAISPAAAVDSNLVRHRRPPEPRDEVEQAGFDSFPSSDPPSWTSGVN